MAFTTIEGAGGAPWTFDGTSAADQVVVLTADDVSFNFEANGKEGDDLISWNGARSVTIRGGSGNDIVTNNIAFGVFTPDFVTASFINGNGGNDTIGNNQYGIAASISTIKGGQADDTLYIGNLQSSLINGNLGEDRIVLTENAGDIVNWNGSSVYGGQGNDRIEIISDFANINNTEIDGQLGDDLIGIDLGDPGTNPSFTGSIANGGDGDDVIDGSGVLVFGRNVFDLTRTSFADLDLAGGDGDDTVFGGAGDDALDGADGADWLSGYAGRDELLAGKGDDVLVGAYYDGNSYLGDGIGDTLTGGTGSNRFVARGAAFSLNGVGASAFSQYFDNDGDGFISNGDTIESFVANGFDVVTDWNSGAGGNLIDTGIAGLATFLGAGQGMSFGFALNILNEPLVNFNYAVRGSYNELNGTFVVDNFGGSDIAVFTPDDGLGNISNVLILDNVSPGGFLNPNAVITENSFVTI